MDLSQEAVGTYIVGGLASFLLIGRPARAPDCSRAGAVWFSGAPGEWEEERERWRRDLTENPQCLSSSAGDRLLVLVNRPSSEG